MYRNSAIFCADSGGECKVFLEKSGEGSGELTQPFEGGLTVS